MIAIPKPFAALAVGLTALFLIAGCGGDPTEEPTATSTEPAGSDTPLPVTGGNVGDAAPEFTGISNWINSGPLTMEGLEGQVVLIDFWTYTCVNCIRTMPFLRDWQAKYANLGLTIVGVHTPEFEFEKLAPNVVKAAEEFGLVYPVAQDNEFGTWRAYSNRFWPAKYLIDQSGVVRYTHFGEGDYEETELAIRELLIEGGVDVSSIEVNESDGPEIDERAYQTFGPEDSLTRELYGGFHRNYSETGIYIGHAAYYEGAGVARTYTDPEVHLNHQMYLQGEWFSGPESIKHGRATEGYEDYIAMQFHARSANAVVDLEEGVEPFEVRVTIQDEESLEYRPLLAEEAGVDIAFRAGESYFNVDVGRMYFVASLPEFAGRELRFSSNSPDFALFAMTFGAYLGVD